MANYANQTTRLIKQSIPVFPTQTSFTQLFGDTFASTPASSLYLLEDLLGIGADLTNNNAATFDSVDDLIIKPVNVVTLDGVNQYLSTPTAVANEVGTGSFVASIWFKTTSTGNTEWIFFYGDQATNEQGWGIRFDTSDILYCSIDDGTTFQQCIDPIAGRWKDDKWHIASMVVDRTPQENTMTLLVDGQFIDDVSISTVTGTLTNVGTELTIGATTNTTVSAFFAGQLSNFSLYIADAADNTVPPDYNLPALMEAGLRESAVTGTWAGVQADSSKRINNRYNQGSDLDNTYVTSVINTSEGIYDIIQLITTSTNFAITDLEIDGNVVMTVDGYSGSTVQNVSFTQSGIYLSAGTHILKFKTNGQNVSSTGFFTQFAMIELIKRDGNNEGDDESTTGTILSDEIIQRTNADFASEVSTQRVFNQRFLLNPSVTGDFTEGDIFIKKGLYDITINADQSSIRAAFNLWFGGVKVLDEDTFWDNASSTNNVPKTVSVFLEGGKTTVRWETGSTATGTFSGFNYIKYDLVTGRGNNDTVDIFPNDPFFEVQNTLTNGINTAYRFNAFSSITSPQVQNDEYGYRKYFSGGTYKVKWINITASNQGIADVFLDGDPTDLIYDNVNLYSAGLETNVEHFAIKTIPRGYHSVHLKAVDKDGASSAWNVTMQLMQFTKIADIESELDDNSDPVHGALVPLAKYIAPKAESSVTLNLSDVNLKTKYSEYKLVMSGGSSALLQIFAELRGLTAGYSQDGYQSQGSSLTAQERNGQASILLGNNTLIQSANRGFDITLRGTVDGQGATMQGGSTCMTAVGKLSLGYSVTAPDYDLVSIRVFTDTSSWRVNTSITVYGVKK